MMDESELFKHPVTVVKADLGARIVPNRFTLNRSPVLIGDQAFGAGTLVFLGFAGAHIGGQRWQGAYRFRLAQAKDGERDFFDVSSLPGGPPVVATEPLTDEDVDNVSTLDPKARTSTEPVLKEAADADAHSE